ncbi:MAG: hypothetical protein O3A92_15255 [Verrucomicrobia bacterium]|nr:hypothetical protein [Verrucomicrobiota bacterium]
MQEGIGKALIVIGDAAETLDTMYPYHRLQEAELIRLTRWFFDEGKPIGSVCDGMEIPARADRVGGTAVVTVSGG